MILALEEALSKIESDNLDLASLINTDEYKAVCETLCMSESFNQVFKGYKLDLIGDLVELKMFGTDYMSLFIVFDLVGINPVYARVDVEDESLKKKIREEAKTNKGVHLRVRCTSSGVNTFELIEIKDLDKPLVFGQFVCSECGYNYKYDNPQGYNCCICGEKIIEVHDFYK